MTTGTITKVAVAGVSLLRAPLILHVAWYSRAAANTSICQATGALGRPLVDQLVKAGFQVTALVRSAGSNPSLPPSAKEVVVDFTSHDSLVAALKGQDAVVSALGSQPGTGAAQKALARASADSGVQRFIPSDFGCNLNNPEVRKLVVFKDKFEVHDELERLANEGRLTWTSVCNNAFLDWGLEHKFILDPVEGKATLWDGGEHPVSFTRLATVGQAVVGVLKHPHETANRAVYVQDAAVSLKKMVEIAKELTPGKTWTVVESSTEEVVKKSNEALAKGIFEPWVFVSLIFRAAFSNVTGAHFANNDNALLGIHELSEAELKAAVKETFAAIPGVY
jgi:putative NADH-flavin reductase